MRKLYNLIILLFITSSGFGQTTADAWINEFHYDNAGGDVNEGVEIVVKDVSTYPLDLWTVILYNGSNGESYDYIDYVNADPGNISTSNGYTIAWDDPFAGSLQNGPDGLALVYDYFGPSPVVVQFLSYESTFSATDDLASGLSSTDIGVSETNSTPINFSLQLSGSGSQYSDFTWQIPSNNTDGIINTGQTFAVNNCSISFQPAIYTCLTNGTGDFDDEVLIEIDFTGSNLADFNIASVTSVAGSIADNSDELNVVENGTIRVEGVFEGEFWEIEISSDNPDCDGILISGTVPEGECNPVPALGWQITTENSEFVIDFDNTVAGVNNGTYNASGFTPTPSAGQLDSNAWSNFGLEDGNLSYGDTRTADDYAKGTSNGGVSSGGFYAFEVAPGNSTFGIQPTGADWTEGSLFLRAQNQTGTTVTSVRVEYTVYINNNEERSNDFRFFYSTDIDDNVYTNVPILDIVSPQTSDANSWQATTVSETITALSVGPSEYFYLRWIGDNVSGTGSVDEFALDDIKVTFNPSSAINYTFTNGVWSPSDPTSGGSTGVDNITISSGNAVLTSDLTCNQFTVSPGASLAINTGVTLTANTLDLDSTSDEFASLILDGTLAGGIINNVTYRRFVNGAGSGSSGGNDLITSPLTGLFFVDIVQDPENEFNLFSNPDNGTGITDILEYLFGPFVNDPNDPDGLPSGDYVNLFINDENFSSFPVGDGDNAFISIEPVKGYRAATFGGTPLAFRGGVNTGTVTSFDFDDHGFDAPDIEIWNLMGNPYPSYLDTQDFLYADIDPGTPGTQANIDKVDGAFGAIYGYNDGTDAGATGIWTMINAFQNPTVNIAPGQGFFLPSNGTGQLTFTPSMRTTVGADDLIQGRDATTDPLHLRLELTNAASTFPTDFYFSPLTDEGLNPGYDAGLYGGTAPSFALYSELLEENQGIPMAIQALGETAYNDVVIPLGVNAMQGEQVTFSLGENSLPQSIEIVLEDNVANTYTLLNSGDFMLTPNVELNGTGRFFLRLNNSALATPQNEKDNLIIYTNDDRGNVVVSGELFGTTTATLFDLQGRQVSSNTLDSALRSQEINVSHLSAGIYIVQVKSETTTKTQKIILR